MRWMGYIAPMGERRNTQRFGGDMRERDRLENPGVDRIILTWIFRKWDGGMDWLYLPQNKERWRVMKLQVP